MAYRIAVLDDDTGELHRTAGMLSLYGETHPQYELEITCFQEAGPFMEAVCSGGGKGKWAFDVLLMDVYLSDGNGIESAAVLREKGFWGVIIFKSSSQEDLVKALSVNPLYYLIKPVSQEEFDGAMDRAVAAIRQYPQGVIKEERSVQPGGTLLNQKEPEGKKPSGHMIKKIFAKWNEQFRSSDR